MAGKDLKFVLDFIAKTQGIEDAADDVDLLGDTLDDTRTDAQKVADAVEAVGRATVLELGKAEAAADALGGALGPELRAKIGESGVNKAVSDFRDLGLTFDQIEADAETLAGAIRNVDAATTQLEPNVRKVGETADNSRAVFANFVGNAAQEIPGVSAAMGPLNTAIGQFAEGTAEGGINLGKMAAYAAPIALLGVAVKSMADNAKRAAEAKAWRTAEVDAFVKSLRKGEDAAEAMVERLTELGKIEYKADGAVGKLFGGDIVDNMSRAGITVDQFADAVVKGDEALQTLANAAVAAGANAVDVGAVLIAGRQYAENYQQAVKTAAEINKVFATTLEDTHAPLVVFGDASKEAAQKTSELEQAEEDAAREARNLKRDLNAAETALDQFQKVIEGDKSLVELELELRNAAEALEEMDAKESMAHLLGLQVQITDTLTALGYIPPETVISIATKYNGTNYDQIMAMAYQLNELNKAGIDITATGPRGTADGIERATYNVTIHATDISPAAVNAAIKEWQRRNGRMGGPF